jgi:hypothetical protein
MEKQAKDKALKDMKSMGIKVAFLLLEIVD